MIQRSFLWARLLALSLALPCALACGDTASACDDHDCVDPPAARCDGTTLITYAPTGTCVGESCRYEAFSEVCASACEEVLSAGGEPSVAGAACVEGSERE